MGNKDQSEHTAESPKPSEEPMRQRLPHIGEKPIVPRRKRALRMGMIVSGALFVTAAAGIRLLQHYEPGPRPVQVSPPAVQSLASLAVKKGFPEQCLQPLYEDPTEVDPTTDPNVEKLACVYSGHQDGQPASNDICEVTLERNTWSDPYNFSFTVTGADGNPIYIGKGSQFSDIPTTEGVPSACVQENITYP